MESKSYEFSDLSISPREVTGSFTTFYDHEKWTELLSTAALGQKINIETVFKFKWYKRLPKLIMYYLYWRMGYRHPDRLLSYSLPDMYLRRVERSNEIMHVEFSSAIGAFTYKGLTEDV